MKRREFIYIARGETAWKIGCTRDVVARVMSLARFESLDLVAVIPGDRRAEYVLHRQFTRLRALDLGRGREWYRDDGALALFVASLPAEQRGHVRFERDPIPRDARQPAPRDARGVRRYDLVAARYKANAIAAHDHSLNKPSPATCARCAHLAAWRKNRARLYAQVMAQPFAREGWHPRIARIARTAEAA